jgi:hypothetical protein
MSLTEALFNALNDDDTLTEMLGTYGDAPCVFSSKLVPEDAPRPYIWISAPLKNKRWGAKLHIGRDTQLEVWCVADETGSSRVIDQIAERVRSVLLSIQLVIDEATRATLQDVDGPVGLETDESVIGRKLVANFKTI